MTVNRPEFQLDDVTTRALTGSFSEDRLSTYLRVTGDPGQALRLHGWNTAISAAFYGPLRCLEVAFRNAVDRTLTRTYGPAWFDNPRTGLNVMALQRIAEAKDDLRRGRYPQDRPHLVAALSLGFWVSLLGRGGDRPVHGGSKADYERTLWRPSLHHAFAHARLSRGQAHQPLDHLRTFRNRIAHHEPIFHRHLRADYASLLNVAGWICPVTRDWIVHHNRVEALLARPPQDGSANF